MRRHRAFVRTVLRAALASSALILFSPAMAAVNPPGQVLSTQAIQQFLANPDALLTQYPNGGPDLIKAVQDLAGSDPATLNALLGLLAKANSEQATAIGTALGKVAKAAVGTDPGFATQIQVGIALANNASALSAFNTEIGGDIQLTAVTGGTGGGGGGGPTTTQNFTGGTSGSTPFNLDTATNNTPDTFNSPSFSPGSPGTSTTTINNNVSQSTP
jgi:hypothetical protein